MLLENRMFELQLLFGDQALGQKKIKSVYGRGRNENDGVCLGMTPNGS